MSGPYKERVAPSFGLAAKKEISSDNAGLCRSIQPACSHCAAVLNKASDDRFALRAVLLGCSPAQGKLLPGARENLHELD